MIQGTMTFSATIAGATTCEECGKIIEFSVEVESGQPCSIACKSCGGSYSVIFPDAAYRGPKYEVLTR